MDTTRSSNTTIHKSTRSPPKVVHISPLISLTTAHPESQWPQLVTGESSPSDAGVDHWGELSSQSETRDDTGLGQSQTMPGPVTYYRLEKLNEVSIILTGHHTALWQQTALELSNNIALIIGQQGLRWKICDISQASCILTRTREDAPSKWHHKYHHGPFGSSTADNQTVIFHFQTWPCFLSDSNVCSDENLCDFDDLFHLNFGS